MEKPWRLYNRFRGFFIFRACKEVSVATVMEKADVTIRTINGERFTPLALAKKLGARVLLESASFQRGRERYSFLLLKEAFRIFQKGDDFFMTRDGVTLSVKTQARDILDVLAHFSRQHDGHAAPFPLPTGGIGYLSYGYCARFDTIRLRDRKDPMGLPDALFLFGSVFLVFDHYTDTISIVAVSYREKEIDGQREIDETEHRINDMDFNFMAAARTDWKVERMEQPDDRAEYLRGVEAVREEIRKGNLLQGVLSRRVQVRTDMPGNRGIPIAAVAQSLPVHVLPRFWRFPALRRLTRGAREGTGRSGRDPAARRHAAPRGKRRRGCSAGKGPSRRSEGARRAPHARRSRAE